MFYNLKTIFFSIILHSNQDKFMSKNSYQEDDKQQLTELLSQYQNLKTGKSYSFIEEDDFEILIDYFNETENNSEAFNAAEIGLQLFPYSSLLMIKKADLLIITRKYEEALQLLEKAELFNNADINIYILKTDAYLALDRQQDAVNLLEESLKLFSGDEQIELLFELADVYDDYEEFDKLFDCLKLVLEQEPNNEEALYKICFWADFTGRNEESIVLHQKIIDEFPYNEIAWFNLGTAYQGLKLYEKAIDAYKYCIVIDEKFDYAYRNMGDAYIRLRKYKDALEVLEKVLELSRPEDVIYEAIGYCYYRLNNPAQARFNYKKAMHLNPDDSKLHYKIATTYMYEKQWQSAIKFLDSALRLHSNVREYNLALGKCYMNLQQYKDAIIHFGIVVKLKPKSILGWEALLNCLLKTNHAEEAVQHALAAIAITENKKTIFKFFYSAALFMSGKTKDAVVQLENAMRKEPKLLKKFIEINPAFLQNQQIVDVIIKFKKGKKM